MSLRSTRSAVLHQLDHVRYIRLHQSPCPLIRTFRPRRRMKRHPDHPRRRPPRPSRRHRIMMRRDLRPKFDTAHPLHYPQHRQVCRNVLYRPCQHRRRIMIPPNRMLIFRHHQPATIQLIYRHHRQLPLPNASRRLVHLHQSLQQLQPQHRLLQPSYHLVLASSRLRSHP